MEHFPHIVLRIMEFLCPEDDDMQFIPLGKIFTGNSQNNS